MTAILKKLAPQSDKQAFWLSLFLCLFICSLILFVISPITGLSKNFGAGNDGYIQLARSLAAGDGYVFEKNGPPVFHRPPLYSLFLVPVALFPENLQRYVIIIPQSILVGFIGMMIFRIAKQLYNQTVATAAVLLFLINPWVYWNAKNPMTAILQTLLYLIFVYLIVSEFFEIVGLSGLIKKTTLWLRGLTIGIFGAGLALTHAAMLPVVFIFIFILFITAIFRNRRHLLPALIAVIVAVCLIAPWTYRNWVVFDRFIPVAGGSGLGYFNGLVQWNIATNDMQRNGESYINASLRVAEIDGNEAVDVHWKGFKDIQIEDKMNRKMVEHLRKNPGLFLKKVLLNIVGFYFPILPYHYLAYKNFSIENIALTIFYMTLWSFALVGIWSGRKEKEFILSAVLVLIAIVFYAMWYILFTIFIGHSLYTLGTIPFLCILSAAGIISFIEGKQVCDE